MFVSPTKGILNWSDMLRDIEENLVGSSADQYKIIIGTDSQMSKETCLVTAVVLYQVGKGACYYYRKKTHRQLKSLRQRIFYEAALSLEVASQLTQLLAEKGYPDLELEIHLDIGQKGQTKDMIQEVVGMVIGSGFDAKIKPDSYGATKVADKHTK